MSRQRKKFGMSQTQIFTMHVPYQCVSTYRWNRVITSEMITVDAVATAAMVRFGSDAELDVTANEEKRRQQ